MPLFKANGQIVFFAHVPKCGGTTVEHSLQESGYKLSMLDQQYWAHEKDRWYKTSPQHIPYDHLITLLDPGLFDYSFAVVREPVDRFLSAFNHNRFRIGRSISFDRFVERLRKRVSASGDYFEFEFDNHFLPADRFVPPDCEVFRLADGLDKIMSTVGDGLGCRFDVLPHQNQKKYDKVLDADNPLKRGVKRALFAVSPSKPDLSDAQVEAVRELYQVDYERFFPEPTTGVAPTA